MSSFLDKKIKQNKVAGFRVIAGKAVVIDPKGGTIHRLNPTATRIWQLAEESTQLSDIISQICTEFEVTPEIARGDTEDFVNTMVDEGLMMVE